MTGVSSEQITITLSLPRPEGDPTSISAFLKTFHDQLCPLANFKYASGGAMVDIIIRDNSSNGACNLEAEFGAGEHELGPKDPNRGCWIADICLWDKENEDYIKQFNIYSQDFAGDATIVRTALAIVCEHIQKYLTAPKVPDAITQALALLAAKS